MTSVLRPCPHLADQPRSWTLEQSARDAFAKAPVGSKRQATLEPGTNVGTPRGHGLGTWCEEIADDGTCPVVQSGGAFGTAPVVVVNGEVAILLMVNDRMPLIRAHGKEAINAVRGQLATSQGTD